MLKKNAILKNKKVRYSLYGIFFILTILLLTATFGYQFYLKPNVGKVKNQIENFVSSETGGQVNIENLNIAWHLTNPRFQIRNFSITDRENNKTINLKAVDFELSWLSLLKLKPVLTEIIIGDLNALIERLPDESFKIAGISVKESSNSNFSDWLLNQRNIKIINAKILWRDHYRNAEDLVFSNINFHYHSPTYLAYLDRHKFNISTKISTGSKNRVNVSGYFDLDSISQINSLESMLNVSFSEANLSAFKQWVDYPTDIKEGYGDLKLQLSINKLSINKVKTIFNVKNFVGNFNKNNDKYIDINQLSGSALYSNKNDEIKLTTTNLNLVSKNINLKNSAFEVITKDNQPEQFKVKLNELNIDAAEHILAQTPFFEEIKSELNKANPSGLIKNFQLSWIKNSDFLLSGEFYNFGISRFKEFPSVKNLTAKINTNNQKGAIEIKSKDVEIDHKILRDQVNFNTIQGTAKWDKSNIKFSNTVLSNNDLMTTFNGLIDFEDKKNPLINIKLNSEINDVTQLKKFYPNTLSPESLHWLDTSLLGGRIENLQLEFNGHLKDFPFNKNNGKFVATGKYKNARIEYATNYPEYIDTDIDININNNNAQFKSLNGKIANNSIKFFETKIDLADKKKIINVEGIIEGPVNSIVEALNNSPLYEDTKSFTNQLIATGNGSLDLKMIFSADAPDDIDFTAKYDFLNATLQNQRIGLPKVDNFNASLIVDRDKYKILNGSATFFSMPINVNLSKENNNTKITVVGYLDEEFFTNNLGSNWKDKITGSSPWKAEANINEDTDTLIITSDLKGLKIDGPEPFKKDKDQIKLTSLIKKPSKNGSTNFVLTMDNSINGKIKINDQNNISGQINILSKEPFSDRNGLSIFANMKKIDLNDFTKLFGNDSSKNKIFFSESKINFEELKVGGIILNRLETQISPSKKGLKLSLYSNELKGNVLYNYEDNLLVGRFNKLIINNKNKYGQTQDKNEFQDSSKPFKIDIKFDEFILEEKSYGSLNLLAERQNQNWLINNFTLTNPFHTLSADGNWQNKDGVDKTSLNFKWRIEDLEQTLNQLGHPNLVRKGEARINGIANWDESPFNFSPDQLTGTFSMDLKKGEILEAEPGIGRLFGLLTLQNLPKRLSLDFSDLFSKGFIYDTISAGVRMNLGILSSNNFKMMGPAAEVNMDGEVDIIKETQNIHVIVRPYVSDSLSLAALAGGPLAGAAAFIAQKILKDPLNKVLTDEYQITGTWDEPVETDKPKSEELSKLVDEEIIEPSGDILDKLNIFKK